MTYGSELRPGWLVSSDEILIGVTCGNMSLSNRPASHFQLLSVYFQADKQNEALIGGVLAPLLPP